MNRLELKYCKINIEAAAFFFRYHGKWNLAWQWFPSISRKETSIYFPTYTITHFVGFNAFCIQNPITQYAKAEVNHLYKYNHNSMYRSIQPITKNERLKCYFCNNAVVAIAFIIVCTVVKKSMRRYNWRISILSIDSNNYILIDNKILE